jgi:hypothetical protein
MIHFKTEDEAIEWVMFYMPIMVRPKSKKAQYEWISPFSSNHAYRTICDELGKRLFELQEKENK